MVAIFRRWPRRRNTDRIRGQVFGKDHATNEADGRVSEHGNNGLNPRQRASHNEETRVEMTMYMREWRAQILSSSSHRGVFQYATAKQGGYFCERAIF
jgi:hypothetical protein